MCRYADRLKRRENAIYLNYKLLINHIPNQRIIKIVLIPVQLFNFINQ